MYTVCENLYYGLYIFSGKLGFDELAMTNAGATQADQSDKEINFNGPTQAANPSFRMVSMERVSQLPVVEELMKLTTHLYGKFRVHTFANTDKASFANVIYTYYTIQSFAYIRLLSFDYKPSLILIRFCTMNNDKAYYNADLL
jgi:hypothetical protein